MAKVRTHRSALLLGALCFSACARTAAPAAGSGGAPVAGSGGMAQEPITAGSLAAGAASPYPDACPDRKAERLLPCSSDPDPCALHSGFAGDEYCLLPPPPGRGLQLHFGPASYTDQSAIAPFVVQPGQELASYAALTLPPGQALRYSYVKLSMRPGSHHLVSSVVTGALAAGFVNNKTDCGGQLLSGFPSTSTPILESPPQGIAAPENKAVAWQLPADASLCLDYHRINDKDSAQLSEVWYNIWFAEPDASPELAHDLVLSAGPMQAIGPHAMQLLAATAQIVGEGRMLSLLGHRHPGAARFAVFLNDLLIYDSYSWSDPRRFEFDSLTVNPVLSPEARHDGAYSGVLSVHDGDALRVQCEVYNASNSPMALGGDLITQEMCVLLMSATAVSLGPPLTQTTDLPP